jgi:hypothetical protein
MSGPEPWLVVSVIAMLQQPHPKQVLIDFPDFRTNGGIRLSERLVDA